MVECIEGILKLLIVVIGVPIGVLLLIYFIYLILLGVWSWLDDHCFTITLGDIKGKWVNISLFSNHRRLIDDIENSTERLRRLNKELIEKHGGEIDRKYKQETHESDTHL